MWEAFLVAEILIRQSRLEDLGELTEIFRDASLSNAEDREILLAHPDFLVLNDTAIVDGNLRVAEIDGLTVGFATGAPAGRDVVLEDLFVHPDWMRKGVATRLVADLVDRSRAAGAIRVAVTANPHASAFYEAAGFRGTEEVTTEFGPGTRMHLQL